MTPEGYAHSSDIWSKFHCEPNPQEEAHSQQVARLRRLQTNNQEEKQNSNASLY